MTVYMYISVESIIYLQRPLVENLVPCDNDSATYQERGMSSEGCSNHKAIQEVKVKVDNPARWWISSCEQKKECVLHVQVTV